MGLRNRFPALALEQILGSLTFYPANRSQVDKYLRQGKEEFDLLRQQNPGLYARLAEARERANRPGA